MRLFDPLLALIKPFAPATGTPPQDLAGFIRWSLAGSQRGVLVGVIVNVLLGLSELVAAVFTGWAIDRALAIGAGDLRALWPIFVVGFAFFMLIRPTIFAASSAIASILLGPHLFPLILSRLNRHTLGQSLQFFENDFAGRLSQKAIQTSRALSDIVVEIVDIVVYILAMFVAALFLLGQIDSRLLLVFGVWFVLWIVLLRTLIPQITSRSTARAHARTNVSGQIVDAYSNITTVKLFAHDDFEDQAALKSMETYRQKAVDFGVTSAQFRFLLVTIGSLLPFLTISASLSLWSYGLATPGDIALTAMVSTRLSQVTNRLSMSAIQLFANLGEVEDGIRTLAPPHAITDRPQAQAEAKAQGAVQFEALKFGYGSGIAALNDFSLNIPAGQKVGLVGAFRSGQIHRSVFAAASV